MSKNTWAALIITGLVGLGGGCGGIEGDSDRAATTVEVSQHAQDNGGSWGTYCVNPGPDDGSAGWMTKCGLCCAHQESECQKNFPASDCSTAGDQCAGGCADGEWPAGTIRPPGGILVKPVGTVKVAR